MQAMVDLTYRHDTPTRPTMNSVDMYTPVHKCLNALASGSTSIAVLVSDSHVYTELDDVPAKDSVLKNPELMAKTFSHLHVDNEKYRCLFNAALTCKDFLDVALDALWEELDTLVPLLKLLPSLQVEDEVLVGRVSQADWDRLHYYSRKVKVIIRDHHNDDHRIHPSTYLQIAQLQSPESTLFPSLRHLYYPLSDMSSDSYIFLFLSPLLDSLELPLIRGFETIIVVPFLAWASHCSQMLSRIVLRNGRMSVNDFRNSIVRLKQLRSLELLDAVFMSDFVLWEVLGALPSLANLTLEANDPASHPAHAPENSNSQSGSPKYFESLETLSVTGSFFLIEHLLDFIDSPCLKSITVCPIINHVYNEHEHEPEYLFTPSMMIVASKWSQSLKSLVIDSSSTCLYAISRCLMLLTVLHEMQTFHLKGWRMENMDNDVRRLVMSWPKLVTLRLPLNQTLISLSALRLIAENCPELRYLDLRLDTSTIPPFENSLRHNLEVLTVGAVYPSTLTQTTLEHQMQVTLHFELIFPYLKSIISWPKDDVFWSRIRDLIKLRQRAVHARRLRGVIE